MFLSFAIYRNNIKVISCTSGLFNNSELLQLCSACTLYTSLVLEAYGDINIKSDLVSTEEHTKFTKTRGKAGHSI